MEHVSDNGRQDVTEITVLTTMLMVVGTFSQHALGPLGPFLVADFTLSRTQFGALTSAVFIGAAVLSPVMGPITDRIGVRITYSLLFLVSAAYFGGIALAPNFLWLLVLGGIGGIGQALVNPVSNKLVAEHVPASRQGLVIGIKQSGVQVGAIVAGLLLPALALTAGWRVAVGAVAGLFVLGWLASASRVPGERFVIPAVTSKSAMAPIAVVGLSTYAFFMGSAVAVVGAYLPLYGHEVVGLSAAVAGMLIGAIGVVGIVARVWIGHLVDQLGYVTRTLILLAVVATVAVGMILVAEVAGPVLLWAGALLFGGSVAWNAVAMLAVVRETGRAATGKASGYVMVGFFCGFIGAPLAFGAAVDATDGYAVPWAALTLCLAAASVGMWVWRRQGLRRCTYVVPSRGASGRSRRG